MPAKPTERRDPEKRKRKRRMPRSLRFTREGRVFVLVTLGVGAAAVNTGNNLLYLVLGLLLSLIVLSGILSEVVLRGLRVERRLPRRAFAGQPCLIELAVENRKGRAPSYSVELEDVAPDEPTDRRCYFLKIAAGREQVGAYPRVPARRGPLRLTEVVVRTRFPFGLFEKSRTLDIEDELLVFPALSHEARRALDLGRTGPDVATARRGSGVEVSGLRDYRDGDEARAIHWRRTAALGRVVVRERHLDAARRLTLVVDEARPDAPDAEWDLRFERMLSTVATAAAHALEEGAGVEAVARSGRSPFVLPGRPPDPIWAFLARLTPQAAGSASELPAPRGDAERRFTVEGGDEAGAEVTLPTRRVGRRA